MELKNRITQVFNSQKERKYFQKNTTAQYRIKKLKAVKKYILDHQTEIESALKEDFSKAPAETLLTEVMPVIAMINLTVKKLKRWMKPKRISSSLLFFGTSSSISYEAKGQVLIISPWNYPFQLNLYPILTAFSAGNTVMIKPSEYTPQTNKIIGKLISEVFDENEICLFEGEVEVTNILMEQAFDHVFFTGSTSVGKIIMEKASKHLTSVSLELGGKSPAIIADDFSLRTAAERVVWGKFVNAGQTCVAPDYILIHKDRSAEFVTAVKEQIENRYGNQFTQNEDFCQIITQRHAQRLKDLVQDAKSKGAKVLFGGHLFENRKFEPTILIDVNESMQVMQEEIFGPILPIVTVDSKADMVKFIQRLDNPLAMYLFSEDKEVIEFFRQNTQSGGLGINETLLHVAHSRLPFGGAGKSGHGRYHGHEGFIEFSNQRAVLKRKFDGKMSYFYPPYTEKLKALIDMTLRKLNYFF
ncbi:MAG: aldehyde dehydrogenase family protein [Halobacteriovoraceae bacterium]|nr:aldehyde dehydrogenase family protein [Halobacteriovoraceae bacterium]|tara:strand:- start:4915 stop:6327 length:1413 start_codon:yes stop_codon:yes gene_type:complete